MRAQSEANALDLEAYNLSLITAKEDVLNPRVSTDWAVFTYERRWSLKLMDSGVGGLDELRKKFSKTLIQYALCLVTDPGSPTPRLILIHWVGEHVDQSRREVSQQHLPAIRRFFKEAGVMLRVQRVEDLKPEDITQALSRVPAPSRTFHKPRPQGSHEVVGTNYTKTNPAIEMKFSKRESFWQRNEREEERRKEAERLRLQEERIAAERERIERERQEEEERERRIQEKERMVEEQRKEQARLEAEQRKMEKARWAQQQKEFEEEMRGRIRRSHSIEMAAEAAALVSGRSLHPRDFFQRQERSMSCSSSPPSTPSSPLRSPSSFSNRTTFRYQRSLTETIVTPTSRSPTFFPGFQKRDSFSGPSSSTTPQCSPGFIFSKASLPTKSPKMDSLPSNIPPPISAARASQSNAKENVSPHRNVSTDVPLRAEYVSLTHDVSPHRKASPSTTDVLLRAEYVNLTPDESPHKNISPPTSDMPLRAEYITPTPDVSPHRKVSPTTSDIPFRAEYVNLTPDVSTHRKDSPSPTSDVPLRAEYVTLTPDVSPHRKVSPTTSDIPFRAEYVTLTPEESPSQNTSASKDAKPKARPHALHIPPSTNIDAPDAPGDPCDVFRAEFVSVDSLSTTQEPSKSPKSPRSSLTADEPAAIKATVSVSTPVTEVAFASITPISSARTSPAPLHSETSVPKFPLTSSMVQPTSPPRPDVPSQKSASPAPRSSPQTTFPPPPAPVTTELTSDRESGFFPITNGESVASTETLVASSITPEAKTSSASSSLKSYFQYSAPPPYVPFSARTADSVTVKAPMFSRSRLSYSGGNLQNFLTQKASNLKTPSVPSDSFLDPSGHPGIPSSEVPDALLPNDSSYSLGEVSLKSSEKQPVELPSSTSSEATSLALPQPEAVSSLNSLETQAQPSSLPNEDLTSLSSQTSFSPTSPVESQVKTLTESSQIHSGTLPKFDSEVPPQSQVIEHADVLPTRTAIVDCPPAEDVPVAIHTEQIPQYEPLPLPVFPPNENLPKSEQSQEKCEVLPVEAIFEAPPPPSDSMYHSLEERSKDQTEVPPPEPSIVSPPLVEDLVVPTFNPVNFPDTTALQSELPPSLGNDSQAIKDFSEALSKELTNNILSRDPPLLPTTLHTTSSQELQSEVYTNQTELESRGPSSLAASPPLVDPLPVITDERSVETQIVSQDGQAEVPPVEMALQSQIKADQNEAPVMGSAPLPAAIPEDISSESSNRQPKAEQELTMSESSVSPPQLEPNIQPPEVPTPVNIPESSSLPISQAEIPVEPSDLPCEVPPPADFTEPFSKDNIIEAIPDPPISQAEIPAEPSDLPLEIPPPAESTEPSPVENGIEVTPAPPVRQAEIPAEPSDLPLEIPQPAESTEPSPVENGIEVTPAPSIGQSEIPAEPSDLPLEVPPPAESTQSSPAEHGIEVTPAPPISQAEIPSESSDLPSEVLLHAESTQPSPAEHGIEEIPAPPISQAEIPGEPSDLPLEVPPPAESTQPSPAEHGIEATPAPPISQEGIPAETSDLPSEVPPSESISESTLLPAFSPPEIPVGSSDLPSEVPPPVNVIPEILSDTSDLPSKVPPLCNLTKSSPVPTSSAGSSDLPSEIPPPVNVTESSPASAITVEASDLLAPVPVPPPANVTKSSPVSTISAEPSDLTSEVPPSVNVTESSPVTTMIPPEIPSETSGLASEVPPPVNVIPEILSETSDLPSEVPPPEDLTKSSPVPTISAEPSDLSSKVPPPVNVTESSPVAIMSLPEIPSETNDFPSEVPPPVNVIPEILSETSDLPSEVPPPDNFTKSSPVPTISAEPSDLPSEVPPPEDFTKSLPVPTISAEPSDLPSEVPPPDNFTKSSLVPTISAEPSDLPSEVPPPEDFTKSSPVPTISAEPSDLPSEVPPPINVPECSSVPTMSPPEIPSETSDLPSKIPSESLAESIDHPSEVLPTNRESSALQCPSPTEIPVETSALPSDIPPPLDITDLSPPLINNPPQMEPRGSESDIPAAENITESSPPPTIGPPDQTRPELSPTENIAELSSPLTSAPSDQTKPLSEVPPTENMSEPILQPAVSLPEIKLEFVDIPSEMVATESRTGPILLPEINPSEVPLEFKDLPSEVPPVEIIQHPDVSLPDIQLEFIENPSYVPPTESGTEPILHPEAQLEFKDLPIESRSEPTLPPDVSLPDIQLEFIDHPSEVPPPETVIGPTVFTDENREVPPAENLTRSSPAQVANTPLANGHQTEFQTNDPSTESQIESPLLGSSPVPLTLLTVHSEEFHAEVSPVGPEYSTPAEESSSVSLPESAADTNGNPIVVETLPILVETLPIGSPSPADSSPEILPPSAEEVKSPEQHISGDLAPNTLFEDPHPGSPPVTGNSAEDLSTDYASLVAGKVIVHDILPSNALSLQENGGSKDVFQCHVDSLGVNGTSAHNDLSSMATTNTTLQSNENDVHNNNTSSASEVLL